MGQVDRALLVKLLNMMASPHDGEALSAARRSSDLMRSAGATWESIIDAEPSTVSTEGAARAAPPSMPETESERDLFGASDALPKDHRPWGETAARATLRRHIRAVPVVARIALFPVWLTAEAYAAECAGRPWPAWLVGVLATAIVALLSFGAWAAIALSALAWF